MDCGVDKNQKTTHRKHAPEDRGPEASLQVLYILPLWQQPSDMERVAVDYLIKAKSIRKGATELGAHRQILSEAMGRMRCAVLPVTQCPKEPYIRQD